MVNATLNKKVFRKEKVNGVVLNLSLEEAAFLYGLVGRCSGGGVVSGSIYTTLNNVFEGRNIPPIIVDSSITISHDAKYNIVNYAQSFKEKKEKEVVE